jgi:hypothetical protein
VVPVERYAEVHGTLAPEHPSITIQVPVSVTTGSVGLSVRPAGLETDLGELPVVEGLVLVDVRGETVDQVALESGQGQPPAQSVNVLLHDPPAGGRLLVQIATSSASQAIQTGTSSGSSPDRASAVSFVLGVQRQDVESAQQDSAPAQGQVVVGTVLISSSAETALSALDSESPIPTAGGTTGFSTDSEGLVSWAPETVTNELVPDASASFNVRLPTGPFASRTAGPVGPIAAISESDLTPAVDRHERGLFQEIDGLSDGDAQAATARRSQLASVDRSISAWDAETTLDADGTDGSVVSLRRGGGFPFKVTASPSGPRADLSALLASLPASPDSEHAPASHEAIHVWPAVALGAEPRRAAEHSQSPDYVTAAWGLALGVGLTTGPLFPDLLAVVQARLPKWLLGARVTKRVGERPRPGRRRFAGLRDWLRRLSPAG